MHPSVKAKEKLIEADWPFVRMPELQWPTSKFLLAPDFWLFPALFSNDAAI